MKVFNLRCNFGHDFEGWFGSAEDFDQQRQSRMLCCPLCESHQVERLPSAPRLNLGVREKTHDKTQDKVQSAAAITPAPPSPPMPAPSQAAWMQAVREMTEHVLSMTENVGERFAEEARRIHYREAPERAIRGRANPAERAALEEEGIQVMHLPLPAHLKDTLQ